MNEKIFEEEPRPDLVQALALTSEVVKLFENTTPTEREIIKVLFAKSGMTTEEVAKKTGKVYPQVCNYLNKLETKGILTSREDKISRKKKQYIIQEKYLRPIWAWIVSQKDSIHRIMLDFEAKEFQTLSKG
jgi:predicted transcriptional regulator